MRFRTVAEAMDALGLTDTEVAAEMGCDRSWITQLRLGRRLRSLVLPLKIARRLNVPIEYLADDSAA